MDLIEQIGAVVGLASFIGLAILAFLYFAQARHVRDLQEKATFVPEELDLQSSAAQREAPPAGDDETAETAIAAPAGQPDDIQAARQVEAARAAAQRRQRFEQRRRPGMGGGRPSAAGGRRPELRSVLVIGAGVAVLLAGVAFGATRLLGGDDESASGGSGQATAPVGENTGPPTEVAVLNGTPVPGLAAKIGEDVRAGGFKIGAVTNTETPFDVTTVMFDPSQQGEADGREVASALEVSQVDPMSSDIKRLADGAPVAVIVGEDRAGT